MMNALALSGNLRPTYRRDSSRLGHLYLVENRRRIETSGVAR
jgi:hypothetical protein